MKVDVASIDQAPRRRRFQKISCMPKCLQKSKYEMMLDLMQTRAQAFPIIRSMVRKVAHSTAPRLQPPNETFKGNSD